MADAPAYLALFALGVWPGGMATSAMRNEVPPGSLDLTAGIEPDMQRQSVLISGTEAKNRLIHGADVTGFAAAGISEDEFEQQGAGRIQGRAHPEAVPGWLGDRETRLHVGRRFSRSMAWSTAA